MASFRSEAENNNEKYDCLFWRLTIFVQTKDQAFLNNDDNYDNKDHF